LENLSQLDGKTVHLRAGSVYKERLEELQDSLMLNIRIVELSDSSEELVNKVVEKQIDYTVVDNDIALVNSTYYDNIDVSLEISRAAAVGWAVWKTSPELLAAINQWIDEGRQSSYFPILSSKSFLNKKHSSCRSNSAFSSISGERIS